MIKCKCIFDKKNLVMYSISASIITLALLFSTTTINLDLAYLTISFLGAIALLVFAFVVGVSCIRGYCDSTDRFYIGLACAAFVFFAVILIIAIPLMIGSVINYQLSHQHDDYEAFIQIELSCFSIDMQHRFTDGLRDGNSGHHLVLHNERDETLNLSYVYPERCN